MHVEFLFDYTSSYSYLANARIRQLGIPIAYTPVDVRAIMSGARNPPASSGSAKLRYASLDCARLAASYGVPFRWNHHVHALVEDGTLDAQLLLRGAAVAQELGAFERYHAAVFSAIWADPRDLTLKKERTALLEEHGIGVPDLWERAADPAAVRALARRNEEAIARGVFGVPMFFVDGEPFFGNERIEFVQARIAGQGAAA
ncbi:2-hydroxychromene-2-carboxylate isomerase [Pendulispora brunnea]|uniref:2-hydroxychromene-2-carboxylate isomerase n=1 Tax=Pendulispora brunnea TaxID=2905690 RepID=A0ABZ2K1G1_9BACT